MTNPLSPRDIAQRRVNTSYLLGLISKEKWSALTDALSDPTAWTAAGKLHAEPETEERQPMI